MQNTAKCVFLLPMCTFTYEWIVVSNYETPDCYILHRHSRRYPFHRQQGKYKDLKEALCYIANHDSWFSDNKM